MQVVRDEPGRLVHLEHVGARLTRRYGARLLLLGLFWAAPVPFVISGWHDYAQHAWMPICFFGAWYAVVAFGTVAAIRSARDMERLRVDRDAGRWSGVERRLWGLREETFEIPCAAIDRIVIRKTRALWRLVPGAVAFELEVIPLGRRIQLELEWVDRFEEVLDLAFRLGLASAMTHFRVVKSTLTEFEVEVTRDGATGTEPIPRIEALADYGADVTVAEDRVSRPEAGPFSPGDWTGTFRVRTWEPGRLIVLVKSRDLWAFGCVAVLLSPFLLAGLMPLWAGLSRKDLYALGFSIVWYGMLLPILAGLYRHGRGATTCIDWESRQLRSRSFFGDRTVPLDAVRQIEVVGVRWEECQGEDGSSFPVFKCQVLAAYADERGSTRSIRLAETDNASAPEGPYRAAWPLARELAHALQVPVRFKDYR